MSRKIWMASGKWGPTDQLMAVTVFGVLLDANEQPVILPTRRGLARTYCTAPYRSGLSSIFEKAYGEGYGEKGVPERFP
jgi:hypothetical protein